MSTQPVLLAPNISSVVASGTLIFAVLSTDQTISQFSWVGRTLTTIGRPGAQFATDGTSLYGITPDRTQIWQWSGQGNAWKLTYGVPNPGDEILEIAAVNGSLFASVTVSGTTSIYQIANQVGTIIGAQPAALAVNAQYLYALTPSSLTVNQYNPASGWAQQSALTASTGNPFQQIFAAGTFAAGLMQGDNLALFDADSGQATAVAGCAPNATYALTPAMLFGLAGSTLYFYDLDAANPGWQSTPIESGSPLTSLAAAGTAVLGLDGSNNLYLVAIGVSEESWMGDLLKIEASFGTLPFSSVTIPGSHDSGSYCFGSILTKGFTAAAALFAQTQAVDLYSQLLLGARFFDIRPQINPADGKIYIDHGGILTDVLLESALNQIAAFVEGHPTELVVAYVNHIPQFTGNPTDLMNMIQQILGQYVAPYPQFSGASTLQGFINAGKTVVVAIDGPFVEGYWTDSQIASLGTYANTNQVSALLSFINSSVASAPAGMPWMLQCQLTPVLPSQGDVGLWGLVFSPVGALIEAYQTYNQYLPLTLAEISKPTVQQTLNPSSGAAAPVNIFIVDAYDSSWTQLAVQMNFARLGRTMQFRSRA